MKSNYKKLGEFIRPVDERNSDLEITNLQGVSITKEFVPSIANIIGTDLSTYKIVRTGQFAYGPVTSRNGDKVSIALLKGEDCIISSSYYPFEVYKPDQLLPEYLMLWFMRPEFDRYARFMSNGSAREVFDWECMCGVELPVPPLSEQQKIVWDYQVITNRIELLRKINDNLEAQTVALYNNFINDNDDKCEETTLGSITSLICRGVAPIYDDASTEIILNQRCIRDHMVDFTQSRTHLPKKISEKWVKRGDLLINSTGAGTLGRTALVLFDNTNVTVDSHVSIVRSNNPAMTYYLGIWAMVHEPEIEGLQEGSTGQTELPRERLVNMPIKVPDSAFLNSFNDMVIPYFEMRLHYQHEVAALQRLVDRIVSSIGIEKGA